MRFFHALPEAIFHAKVMAGDVIEIHEMKIMIHSPSPDTLARAKKKMVEADAQLGAISDWEFILDELMDKTYPSSDTSISNQSSIVFTLEYERHKFLFCGDAWSTNIPGGLYDFVKLPHHGSIRNISDKLLSCLETHEFLICADGTSHPNKQTIAKLLQKYGTITIYSNYDWWMKGFLKSEDMKYVNSGKLIFKV